VAPSKILIVDDDQDFAEALAQLCKTWGYSPTIANSGSDALKELEEEIFDFAIIDNVMPELSGVDLVGAMRRGHYHLPLAICTGFQTQEIKPKMHGLRIADILVKPIDHQRVQALIQTSVRPQ
jgi:DNA-binding NtrC family response regulator